ncbi:hypothetical protein K1T71_014750 [Dendrolimus kikuchii]|nr:hypothetical protein K1T71_014750 [Dendrolimus kikuchii]
MGLKAGGSLGGRPPLGIRHKRPSFHCDGNRPARIQASNSSRSWPRGCLAARKRSRPGTPSDPGAVFLPRSRSRATSISAFLDHLNSISSNIKFTMKLEANNKLAFLDVLILRNPDNTLGHTVYRKPTHTDKYLNGSSHHHPSQLATVGKSLFQRAQKICDENHIAGELQHVKRVLQRNQLKTPHQRHKGPKPPSVERCPATLPYIKGPPNCRCSAAWP